MTPGHDPSALLAAALAPEPRAPDRAFAARVHLAVREEERYARARKAARRRIGSDLLVLVGLTGPALGIARILTDNGSLAGPATAAALVATLAVGGWIMLSGELRRLQAL